MIPYAAKVGIQSTADQNVPRKWANTRQARGFYVGPPSSCEDAIELIDSCDDGRSLLPARRAIRFTILRVASHIC